MSSSSLLGYRWRKAGREIPSSLPTLRHPAHRVNITWHISHAHEHKYDQPRNQPDEAVSSRVGLGCRATGGGSAKSSGNLAHM
jgi:hypothetical protein